MHGLDPVFRLMMAGLLSEEVRTGAYAHDEIVVLVYGGGQVHVAQSYVGRDDLVVVCRIVDVSRR